MKKFGLVVILVSSTALLAGCSDGISDPVDMPNDPLTQQLVGKTLTNQSTKIQLQEGNMMTGRTGPSNEVAIDGTWQIREGRFCRTLTSPPQLAGTECQDISIDGDTVTFDTPRGQQTYIISES